MINSIGATKRKLGDEINWEEKAGEATHPAAGSSSDAAFCCHDSGIVQGPADSEVPVKGHCGQEEGLRGAHGEEEIELEEAAREGDGAGL